MKKTTSTKLSKKLASYGALTAAIVGVADANGQSVVYTDITDFTGAAGDEFFLDLDNNATNDFRVHAASNGDLFFQPLTASNEALGTGSDNYGYPFALDNGDPISASPTGIGMWLNQSYSAGAMSLFYNFGSGDYAGNFNNVTDKYIGVRFNISGNTHYGWVRLDVGLDAASWTIKDFAYVDTPNIGLNAGEQTTLNADVFTTNSISIVANKQNIMLYNLPNQTNYTLFSLTGKLVLQGTANSGALHTIESNNLAAGTYIVQLIDTANGTTINKKIIL